MTSFCVLLRTFAVWVSVIVIGLAPQLKVITPPAVTADTTAADVQLAGVPSPMTWSGWPTFSSPIPVGTGALPFGLPGLKLTAPEELVTVTVTGTEVRALPAASRAIALSVCPLLAAVVVSHCTPKGALVSAAAMLAPSTWNWTLTTPTLSPALAETVMVLLTVVPLAGAVRAMDGAVVSGAAVVKLASTEVATLAAASADRTR